MGLELRKDKKGLLRSKWWYGRYIINGERRFVNLGVEVKGTVPENLRTDGDTAFECSRILASEKLRHLISTANNKKCAEHHLEELYELKAGNAIQQVPLAEIEQRWLKLPKRKKRSDLWEKNQCTTLRKFSEFVATKYPAVKTLSQVSPKIAQDWLYALDEQGFAAATYNDKLHLLKGFFDRIGHESGVLRNPFAGCQTKLKTTVHHQPFTPDELNRILQHADKVMRPIFLVGMCTAMRQGDCCMLKWQDIDLLEGFITVKTSKTGETAEIPLFPLLRAEIENRERTTEYVFPEAAALYKEKNFGLSWRIYKVLRAAGIETTAPRPDGLQKATLKGFHSLRTTWITMALSAGVPMELVRRVTGHSTVDVVLKHYFRPGREAFRSALETAMPKMLTCGEAPAAEAQPKQKAEGSTVQGEKTPREVVAWLVKHGEDLEKAAILRKLAEIESFLAA